MDLEQSDQDLEYGSDFDKNRPETEAERVLRESLERGRQRAEESRMVSPLFLVGMMLIIIATMIGLMFYVNALLANKKPISAALKQTTAETEQSETTFQINLTQQICFENVDLCFSYPENWTAQLIQAGNDSKLEFKAKDTEAKLSVLIGARSQSNCNDLLKAQIFKRQTLEISQLSLENSLSQTDLWARSFVQSLVAGEDGDPNLKIGIYFPVLSIDMIAKDQRKFAVVGEDQINSCQRLEPTLIKNKSGQEVQLSVVFSDDSLTESTESTVSEADLSSAGFSSSQKAEQWLKSEIGQTMYKILASAKNLAS